MLRNRRDQSEIAQPTIRWDVKTEEIVQAAAYRYTDFQRSHRTNANLGDLNLRNFDFKNADLHGSGFFRSDLDYAIFENALVYNARFASASLRQADFEGADLASSDFANADLAGAYMYGARLEAASGIKTAGPVGQMGRIIFAYTRGGQLRIQAGCYNGTPEALLQAIDAKYKTRKGMSAHYRDYRDTVRYLEAWGKRELRRVNKLKLLD